MTSGEARRYLPGKRPCKLPGKHVHAQRARFLMSRRLDQDAPDRPDLRVWLAKTAPSLVRAERRCVIAVRVRVGYAPEVCCRVSAWPPQSGQAESARNRSVIYRAAPAK